MQSRKIKFDYLSLDSNLWPLGMQKKMKNCKKKLDISRVEPGSFSMQAQSANHYTMATSVKYSRVLTLYFTMILHAISFFCKNQILKWLYIILAATE